MSWQIELTILFILVESVVFISAFLALWVRVLNLRCLLVAALLVMGLPAIFWLAGWDGESSFVSVNHFGFKSTF